MLTFKRINGIDLNLNLQRHLSMCELPTGFAVSTTLNCLADTPSRLPNRHHNYDDDVDDDDDDDDGGEDDDNDTR